MKCDYKKQQISVSTLLAIIFFAYHVPPRIFPVNKKLIPDMKHFLSNPEDPTHEKYLEKSFNSKPDIEKIKGTVKAIEEGKMRVKSRLPLTDDLAATVSKISVDGKQTPLHILLGKQFFHPDRTDYDNAGVLLHEGVHYFAAGSDHIVKAETLGQDKNQVYQRAIHSHLGNPDDKNDEKAKKNLFVGGGCT